MKLIESIISIGIFIVTIHACDSNPSLDFNHGSIPETIEIRGSVFIDSLLSPLSIEVYKESLLVLESNGDYRLKTFDLLSGQMQQSLLKIGRGSNEVVQPGNICVGRDTCWVFDILSKKILGFQYQEQGVLELGREFKLEDRSCTRLIVSDTGYYGFGHSDSMMLLSEYSSNGEIIGAIAEYPDFVNRDTSRRDLGPLFLSTVYKNRFGYSPKEDLIAVAYTRFNALDIYSSNGNLVHRITGPEDIQVEVKKLSPRPGTVIFDAQPKYLAYRRIYVGDFGIWASHSGVVLTRTNFADTIPSKIYCFSWTGELIRELRFAEPVLDFTIDSSNKVLYYLTYRDLVPCVCKFHLNNSFNVS
jgi:hypothetical protein